jgi:hypothetical protein
MGKSGSPRDDGKKTAARGQLTGGFQAVTVLLFGLLPAVAIFAITYLAYVNAQQTYLTNRNYRVLATASDQISGRLEGIERALQSRFAIGDEEAPFVKYRRGEHKPIEKPASEADKALNEVRAEVSKEGGGAVLQFTYSADNGNPLASSDLRKLVGSILLRDEFDDVLLIQPPNDVLYQRRMAHTGAVPDLAALLARADLASEERSNFDALLRALEKKTSEETKGKSEETKPRGDLTAARARLFSEPIHTHYLGNRYVLFFRPVHFPSEIGSMLARTGTSPQGKSAESRRQEEPEWWLCGLVRETRFSSDTHRIPTAWLIAALLLLAMALLAWPLLKIWYIGPRERFRAFDVALLAVSALIGSALVTFALLDSYAYVGLAEEFDGELVRLADQIEHNFRNELRVAYDQLAVVQPGAVPKCQRKGAPSHPAHKGDGRAILSGCPPVYRYFDRLMVLNAEGKPEYGWTAKPPRGSENPWEIAIDEMLPKHLRLADRSYFKQAQSGDMWRFEFDDQAKSGRMYRAGPEPLQTSGATANDVPGPAVFAIESIQARTTGENTVVMAVPLENHHGSDGKPEGEVAIIATRLLSVIDPVMPPGFGFAVIDRLGNVLLHSDEKRNLHEDLFLETDGNQDLYDAVVARRATHVDARYDGKERRLYVYPLRDTDWTLVVFADKTIAGGLNAELAAVWLIAFLLLYAFPYLLIGAVALIARGGGGGWLWPDPRRIRSYVAMGIVLSIAAAVVLEGMNRRDALINLAIIGLTPLLTLSLLRVILGPPLRSKPLRGVLALAALLGSGGGVLLLSYGDVSRSDPPGAMAWALLFAGGATVLGWVVAEVAATRTPAPHSRPDPAALCRGYAFFLASLLLVLSVAPAAVVFSDAERQASVALVKFGQRRFAFALGKRAEDAKDHFSDSGSSSALFDRLATDVDLYQASMYTDRLDFRPVGQDRSVSAAPTAAEPVRGDRWTRLLCGEERTTSGEDGDGADASAGPQAAPCSEWVRLVRRNFTALVTPLIPALGEDMGHLWPRLYDRSSDFSWRWEEVKPQRLRFVLVDRRLRSELGPKDRPVDLVMEGTWRALSLPSTASGWMLLLLLGGGALATSVFLLASAVRRVFLLDPEGFVDAVQPALPGSGAWLFVHLPDRQKAADVPQTAVLDLSTLTEAEQCTQWRESATNAQVAVVDHFEHRHEEAEWRAAKLALVEALAAEPARGVVLLSEIDPVEYGSARAADPEGAGGETALNEVARWSRALSTFRRRWWQPSEQGEAAQSALPEGAPAILREVLSRRGRAQESHEARCWRLWWECTTSERLALVHLAKEGFLNPNNRRVAYNLMRRGIVRRTPRFRLASEGLRRFVLRAATPETVAAWEREGERSVWARLRMPLMALLVLAAVFFFTTQPDVFNWAVGTATAVTAAVPVLLRMFGLFGERGGGSDS